MKEKPDLQDRWIIDQLQNAYGMEIARLDFLPIGDISSAKYQVVTREPATYFLKLRKDGFKEISMTVPHFLHEQGIYQIISPLKAQDGQLWTSLDPYFCILYPFIKGQNGFQNLLSDKQWIELGATLKGVHSINLPPDFHKKIPSETYSSHWRERVKDFLVRAEQDDYADPVAATMAADLLKHQHEIRNIIERAEEIRMALQPQPLNQVLCHSDLHAGNLLLEESGDLHIIDWDDPIIAPKERDLMFIGGGIGGIWNTPREEALFYQGYGQKDINLAALTYYRYERIVTDIGEFSQLILSSTEGGADRERSLQKFKNIFLPDQLLEIACQTDQILKRGK